MMEPDYDKSRNQLLSFTSEWAFFRSKSNELIYAIARCVDGDWELNDSGDHDAMMAKFMRMAVSSGAGTLNTVDSVTGKITQIHISAAKPEPTEEPEPALAEDRYRGNPMFGRF